MAITLIAVLNPGSPVLPGNTSKNSFDKDYARLTALPLKQRIIVALLGMIHTMYLTVDYRTNHEQLRTDAMVYLGDLETPLDLWASIAAMSWSDGKVTDPTFASDINSLIGEAKEFNEQSEEELIRLFMFVSLL